MEVSKQPFIVWTDHKNLSYICSAKRLNSRQTSWSPFFDRFNFTPTCVQDVFRFHGIPLDIVSDRGPQFISQVWKAFCSALGTSVSLSSGFHPQTNGQTERANQNVKTALRCLTVSNPMTWSEFLPWVKYAHNSSSPFMCSLRYQRSLFPRQELDLAVSSVQHHLQRCQRIWKEARAALLQTTGHNKSLADHRRTPAPNY